MADVTSGTANRSGWTIGLWVAQAVLAAFYSFAGFAKLSKPMAELAAMGMNYAVDYPELLTRFIGTMEVLGALGLLLPAFTRILPRQTPLAALGFSVLQVLAIGLHAMRGETGQTLPINLVLLALSLFVVWGRMSKAPIAPR
ncbi:DoxX family protein [uncultured Devosia sp.]|uniref:DoxX family protein n=1 Tax=uncultured Devosia sp. TaxID=211434 RepID=UPI0035CA4A0B